MKQIDKGSIIIHALKPVRNSSIELLRILAACAVVILHYNGMGKALYYSTGLSHELLIMLECLCVCAVDLFIMISGYFLCQKQQRTWDKPIYLLLLLSAIRLTIYVLGSYGDGYSIANLIHSFIPPKCYFILLYIVLYIISPYVNIVMNCLNAYGRTVLILIMLILFSIYPTLIDSYEIMIHQNPMGVSTVGAWGQQHGYTIVGFVLFYAVGAWLRMNQIGEILSQRKIMLLVLAIVLCIFIWFKVEEIFFHVGFSLVDYNSLSYTNPLVIFLTALLLLLFSKLSFQSNIINNLAKSTFVCYIFHLSLIPHL